MAEDKDAPGLELHSPSKDENHSPTHKKGSTKLLIGGGAVLLAGIVAYFYLKNRNTNTTTATGVPVVTGGTPEIIYPSSGTSGNGGSVQQTFPTGHHPKVPIYSIVPSHAANLADQAAGIPQYQWSATGHTYLVDTNPNVYNGVTYTKLQ